MEIAKYTYGFWARRRWLRQSVISLLFVMLVCLPVVYLLGTSRTFEITIKLLVILGVPILLIDLVTDRRMRKLYFSIRIDSDGLHIADAFGSNRFVRWSDVQRVDKITESDKEYFKAVGKKGIRLVLTDSSGIPVFESIRDYDGLKREIGEHISGSLD